MGAVSPRNPQQILLLVSKGRNGSTSPPWAFTHFMGCQSCSHCSSYPLFAYKSGISGRGNGGAWGCRVDGRPTTTEMPVAPSGRTFLPGAGIKTIFSTPVWLFGWWKRCKTAKTGKRVLFTSRMEASLQNISERLYQTMPWFSINPSPPLLFHLKCIFLIVSPLGRLAVPNNSI